MKKRLLFISITLVLLATIIIPASVLAASPSVPIAKRFNIVMTPNRIDDTVLGTTWPVRNSAATNVWPVMDLVTVGGVPSPTLVGWIVNGRSIYGTSTGDLNGNFTFTYDGVLDVLQSGSIQGILTLQAGGLDNVYLALDGDSQAEVIKYFTFAEIQAWCAAPPAPIPPMTAGVLFSMVYSSPDLALVPDSILQMAYGASAPLLPPLLPLPPLPLLPKTLTADFSGSAKIETGTGTYSGVSGRGQLVPNKKDPLVLSVFPTQHVYNIDGNLKLTGTYIKKQPRQLGNLDRDKLDDAIRSFKDRFDKDK